MLDDVLLNKSISGNPAGNFLSPALAHVQATFKLSPEDMEFSYRETKGLSHLQDVLLGIDKGGHILDDCLSQGEVTLDAMKVTDKRGRNSVTWAAEFGWADALKHFIRAGADPSQTGPAVCGFQPLLILAISSPAAQRGDRPALDTNYPVADTSGGRC